MTKSITDNQERAEVGKDEAAVRAMEEKDVRTVLDTPEGRRLMRWILEICGHGPIADGCMRYSEVDGHALVHDVFGNLGKREIGLRITERLIDQAREQYLVMYAESIDDLCRVADKEKE